MSNARTSLSRPAVLLTLAAAILGAAAAGAIGGPVTLSGHDADDHGFEVVYAPLFDNILGQVSNGATGVLAIGADPGSRAASWISGVASQMAVPQVVTFVNDSAISTADFGDYAILHVPSDNLDTTGGISQAESDLLNARSVDVANFLNGGGGLFGLTQGTFANAYDYLAGFAPIQSTAVTYTDVDATAEGEELGISDTNLDGCCWHNVFYEFPSFLSKLASATDAGVASTRDAAIIGGSQVAILTLAPPSPGRPDEINTLSASGAVAAARIDFLGSPTPGSTPVPGCPNLSAGLADPLLLGSETADASGAASIDIFVPASFTDRTAHLQALDRAHCIASNLVDHRFTDCAAPLPGLVSWWEPSQGATGFRDDFDSGPSPLWGNERGSWAAAQGSYSAQSPNNCPATYTSLPYSLTDLDLELDVLGADDGGIWLHSDAAGNGVLLVVGGFYSGHTGLYWHISNSTCPTAPAFGVVSGLFSPGDDIHLRIEVRGTTYRAYFNDATEPTTTLVTAAFPAGQIALYDTSDQRFDNVFLDSLGVADLWDGNDGSALGGTSAVPGKVNQAFHFDSDDDGVTIPDAANLHQEEQLTVEFWVNGATTQDGSQSGWITLVDNSHEGADTSGSGWFIQQGPDFTGLYFGAYTTAGRVIADSGISITDGVWHHVAGTFDAAAIRIYVDGVERASAPTGPGTKLNLTRRAINLGFWWNGVDRRFFRGDMDEVSLYDRALAAEEIQAIYAADSAGKCRPGGPNNQAPGFVPPTPISLTTVRAPAGALIEIAVAASDPDADDVVAIDCFPLPPGATWESSPGNPATGLLRWQPAAQDVGQYTPTFAATDGSLVTHSSVHVISGPCDGAGGLVCTPPAPGLMAWFPGEGSGVDIAGTSNGRLLGSTTFARGRTGTAFHFDSDDDGVEIADNGAFQQQETLTVEFWVKGSAAQAAGGDPLFTVVDKSHGGGPPTDSGWFVQGSSLTGDLTFGVYLDSAPVDPWSVGLPDVRDDQWHHIAGVYDGAAVRAYFDGAPQGTTPATGRILTNSLPLNVGFWHFSGERAFRGSVDELAVYDRALAAGEIEAIYLAGRSGKCPPKLLAHWTLDEAGGSSARDLVGDRIGLLAGAARFLPAQGIAAGALGLNSATGDLVSVGDDLALQGVDFTILAWIQTASIESAPVVGKHEATDAGGYYLGLAGDPGENPMEFFASSAGNVATSVTAVNDELWHQVAGVYRQGGTSEIFVDGSPNEDGRAAAPIGGTAAPLLMGADSLNGLPVALYSGLIDDVRIYERALTGPEVQRLADFIRFTRGAAVEGSCGGELGPACVAAPGGLISWWRAEGSGADSWDGNHAQLEGDVSFGSGVVGRAFEFDGDGEAVTIPDAANLDPVGALTVEHWVRIGGVQDGADQDGLFEVLDKGHYIDGDNTAGGWFVEGEVTDSQNGKARVVFGIPGLSAAAEAYDVSVETWHHVAGVYDGLSIAIYVDGALAGQNAVSGQLVPNAEPVSIGYYQAGRSRYFRGAVDEVALYDRPLAAAEISAIYSAGAGGKCDGR